MANFKPNFSLILFSNSAKKVDLNKLFSALVNSHKLELEQTQLQQILKQDLSIDTSNLNQRLLSVLADALLYYMSVWSGWRRINEYRTGRLFYKKWFEMFRHYLQFKSNYIIQNEAKFLADLDSVGISEGSQTDASGPQNKPIAPYELCVRGPPSFLNNIVFMESKGDILVKQHMEKKWQALSLKELLNWPHVSVELNLPDIALKRSNIHQFQRYIAVDVDNPSIPEVKHILHIKRTSKAKEKMELKPYSYDFIDSYWRQFSKSLYKIPGVSTERLKEVEAVFTEFLADMKEANVYNCTMCPNVSVGYHIGKCKYFRNKKTVINDKNNADQTTNTLNFYETIIPQIDFTLEYFEAVQEHFDKRVSFKSLNKLENRLLSVKAHPGVEKLKSLINNTCIVYSCTLCTKTFSGPHAHFNLTQHFAVQHKAERSVLCYKCHEEFEVQFLAAKRWRHKCI